MKKNILAMRLRRKKRVGAKLHGTHDRPRVSVYRSNKYIYAQAIDDDAQKTLASADSRSIKKAKATKSELAGMVGKALGKHLLQKNIKKAIFDRGQYLYNGRVKTLAEGLREEGIIV